MFLGRKESQRILLKVTCNCNSQYDGHGLRLGYVDGGFSSFWEINIVNFSVFRKKCEMSWY